MTRREALHNIFVEILGSQNVYFQPPESIKLKYPCIIYETARPSIFHANDKKYLRRKCYSVSVIDRDPDSPISEKIANLPLCSFDRWYASDYMNHFIYTIYY